MRRAAFSLRAIAVLAAAAAALALGACGRKAGLDPPPGASIGEPTTASAGPAPANRETPNSKRSSPLDWLLD